MENNLNQMSINLEEVSIWIMLMTNSINATVIMFLLFIEDIN